MKYLRYCPYETCADHHIPGSEGLEDSKIENEHGGQDQVGSPEGRARELMRLHKVSTISALSIGTCTNASLQIYWTDNKDAAGFAVREQENSAISSCGKKDSRWATEGKEDTGHGIVACEWIC